MIDVSPSSSPTGHPPPTSPAAIEPPTVWARLYPYLFLTVVALLISSCAV